MFRILFCASVQCSAIPLLNISTLCFSFSTLIRACPFRCVRLLSFLCLLYAQRIRVLLFRVDSSLFDSLPWRLSWNRICTYLFRFRSGPIDSVSHVVIHILAIHFLHKAALCSSVSVSLHIRSNPYQINAFLSLFASTPVNSPPFQFISTRNPSSPSVSISVLLHVIPYRVVPLLFQICSFLDLAPLLLFLCSFVLLPSSLFLCAFAFLCYSTPIRFTFLLLHFAAPWLISLPLHRLPHQFFFLPYQIFSFLGGSVLLLFYTPPLPYFLTVQGVLMP